MSNIPQIRIPATYMRGGTSKGVFFKLADLPESCQVPGEARAQSHALTQHTGQSWLGMVCVQVAVNGQHCGVWLHRSAAIPQLGTQLLL